MNRSIVVTILAGFLLLPAGDTQASPRDRIPPEWRVKFARGAQPAAATAVVPEEAGLPPEALHPIGGEGSGHAHLLETAKSLPAPVGAGKETVPAVAAKTESAREALERLREARTARERAESERSLASPVKREVPEPAAPVVPAPAAALPAAPVAPAVAGPVPVAVPAPPAPVVPAPLPAKPPAAAKPARHDPAEPAAAAPPAVALPAVAVPAAPAALPAVSAPTVPAALPAPAPAVSPAPAAVVAQPAPPAKAAVPDPITRRGTWPIRRSWTEEELVKFGQFVENIYEKKRRGTTKQKQAKLDVMLSDPEMNLFLSAWAGETKERLSGNDLAAMRAMTHCGSFPKLIHIYYSYMRGLPCTVSYVTGKGGDIRYSRGNRAVGFLDSYSFGGSYRQFLNAGLVSGKFNNFTTGNYRTAPDLEGTDSVPIKVDPKFLRPGCLAYNAGGHALLVAKVTPEGEVFFLDAHPDTSISACKDLSAVPRVSSIDRPDSCTEGFRMMRLAVTKTDALGRVVGVRPMTNEEMKPFGYSTEQYEAARAIREKEPLLGRRMSSYSEYVQAALRTSREKEKPFDYIRKSAERIYGMFETRRDFVDAAWKDVLANGSITLPDESTAGNIYQADGRWEVWSSPSSDVDRKCAVVYLADRLEAMLNAHRENRDALDLEGREAAIRSTEDLAREMLAVYREEFGKYAIEYATSTGGTERLTLLEICNRLWDLSFDPNHPPEVRWGADPAGLASYRKVSTPFNSGRVLGPADSYKIQRGLRFLLERQDTPTRVASVDLPKNPLKERPEERLTRHFAASEAAMVEK